MKQSVVETPSENDVVYEIAYIKRK